MRPSPSARVVARACVALALVAGLGAGAHRARADAAAEARFFDGLAREELAARHYDRALSLFLESHRAAPSPGALYNVAVAAMLAHEEALAYAHFEEFLASASTDAVRREDAARRMVEMEARLCRVRVESTPPGATITIDREDLGMLGRTPRTVVVDPGHHVVHLSLSGHEPATAELDAAVGAMPSVSSVLAPIFGTIELSIVPESARVTARAVDGSEVVVEDARAPMRVPVGLHAMRVEAPGYAALEREILVTEAASASLRVSLEPVPVPTGRLLVDTGVVSARVLVDGSARASTPARVSLEVGVHAVRVEADGYRPWEGEVEIVHDRARFVDLVLVPAE